MSAGLALPGIADACDVRVAVQRVRTAVEGRKVGSVQLGEMWVYYRSRFSYIIFPLNCLELLDKDITVKYILDIALDNLLGNVSDM